MLQQQIIVSGTCAYFMGDKQILLRSLLFGEMQKATFKKALRIKEN